MQENKKAWDEQVEPRRRVNDLEQVLFQNQLEKIIATNDYAAKFGLELTKEEAEMIVAEKMVTLREQRRVEFGESIVPSIIRCFADTSFIDAGNYADAIVRLQDIFYQYKNATYDTLTDDELLEVMREQFETVAYGDFDYLEESCLANYARAIKAGYRGDFYHPLGWDRNLYLQALAEEF